MKPRLEPAPYTWEDSDIWAFVGLREPFTMNDFLELASAIGDRHDADLMLFFMTLGWKRTKSTAYLYIRMGQAMDDPANWRTVLP